MKNKTLLEIAIIVSLAGIFLLIFISDKIELSESNIEDLTKDRLDRQVKIKGIITNIVNTPGLTILNIKDNTGEITIITYETELLLEKDQLVIIEGNLIEYNGKLEVEADLIKIIQTSEP